MEDVQMLNGPKLEIGWDGLNLCWMANSLNKTISGLQNGSSSLRSCPNWR